MCLQAKNVKPNPGRTLGRQSILQPFLSNMEHSYQTWSVELPTTKCLFALCTLNILGSNVCVCVRVGILLLRFLP
jgi:hypothetical protein